MDNLLVIDHGDVVYTVVGNVRLNIVSSSIGLNVGVACDGRNSTDQTSIMRIQSVVLVFNMDGSLSSDICRQCLSLVQHVILAGVSIWNTPVIAGYSDHSTRRFSRRSTVVMVEYIGNAKARSGSGR